MKIGPISISLRQIKLNILAKFAARDLNRRWSRESLYLKERENIGAIISVTSYPPRFKTLSLTIKSLMLQAVRAEKLVLWIADNDMDKLPEEVLNLRNFGLEIKSCEDIRSYKKIIPSLRIYADKPIIIADDDVYYPSTWLSELFHAWNGDSFEAICRRGHKIKFYSDGSIAPYSDWTLNIDQHPGSPDIFATGMGGVLYPPGIFHSDVLDSQRAMQLCPTGDDIWLYWMVRRAGGVFRKIGDRSDFTGWEGTELSSLTQINVPTGGNDDQIARMVAAFGVPSK
jgi:hypothetical protein